MESSSAALAAFGSHDDQPQQYDDARRKQAQQEKWLDAHVPDHANVHNNDDNMIHHMTHHFSRRLSLENPQESTTSTTTLPQAKDNNNKNVHVLPLPTEISECRTNMMNVLTQRLAQKTGKGSNPSSSKSSTLLLQKIEGLLYKQARGNLQVYANPNTLNMRLQRLLRHRGQVAKSKRQRMQWLDQNGHAQPCLSVVHEIRSLRANIACAYSGSGGCCGGTAMCKAEWLSCFDTELPLAVRRLYFECPLVAVVDQAPLERLVQISPQQWKRLEEQARQHLHEAQEWHHAQQQQQKRRQPQTEKREMRE